MRTRGRLAVLAGGAAVLGGGGAATVGVLALTLVLGAGPELAPPAGADDTCPGAPAAPAIPVLATGPAVASLTAEQTRNARAIVQVAAQASAAHGLDAALTRRAAVIGIMTAMQESSLIDIGYGDAAGPDSRGLFQQRAPWGPLAERMDPAGSARLFYDGGHGGQPGLFDIAAWRTMPLWAAAQAVQVSAFPTAYAKWEGTADAVVAALLGAGPAPRPTAVPAAFPTQGPAPVPSSSVPSSSVPSSSVPSSSVPVPGASGSLQLPGVCDGTTATPAGAPGVPVHGWVLPLPPGSYTPTSPFGWRMHPILHEWRLHTGQDLGAAQGTPVFDVFPGTVVFAGPNDGYGNQVVVQHAGGVQSAYNHLSAILVPVGAQVTAGQQVGRVGSTGLSTAPHLHFEIRLNGTPVDPVPFLRAHGVDLLKG